MDKKSPSNTSSEFARMSIFLEAIALGTNPDIVKQEAQGQKELISSDVLPTILRGGDEARKELISLGFIFGDIVPNDPLFQYVTLPNGWKKVATDHDMWSEVHDSDGKIRISVFYKAAFYDRNAFMRIGE